VLILLMDRSGQGTYHSLTIPELFDLIQHKVKSIDAAWEMMLPLLANGNKKQAQGSAAQDTKAPSSTDPATPSHGSRRLSVRAGAVSTTGSGSAAGGGHNSHKLTRTARYRDIDRLKRMVFPYDVPTLLVRRHCVLLLLDPLRAVVFSDQLLVVVPDGADSMIAVLNTYMSVSCCSHIPYLGVQRAACTVLVLIAVVLCCFTGPCVCIGRRGLRSGHGPTC
jgi:hypothetical protein